MVRCKNMRYKIFAALHDELNAGLIWVGSPVLPSRCVVKVRNPKNRKKVYCEALQIDDNFSTKYNADNRYHLKGTPPDLVINSWYRKRLGDFPTQSCQELEITRADNLWGKLWACLHHPQVVVRLATHLALLSVTLGIISVALAVWSPKQCSTEPSLPVDRAQPAASRPSASGN